MDMLSTDALKEAHRAAVTATLWLVEARKGPTPTAAVALAYQYLREALALLEPANVQTFTGSSHGPNPPKPED